MMIPTCASISTRQKTAIDARGYTQDRREWEVTHMDTSLKLQTNIIMIIAFALVSAAGSIITHPFPALSLAAGIIFGLGAGFMQRQSLTLAPAAFRSANTALAVRAALMSTTSGKRAIHAQWILLSLLLASAYWTGNPFAPVAGFAVFMCVRDLVALKAVKGLTQTTGSA